MGVIGVTGHVNLTAGSVPLVRDALRALLGAHRGPGLVGVSCLAAGADCLFAEEVVAAGGGLVAVIPSRDYREAKVAPGQRAVFDRLVDVAAEVVVCGYETAGRAAYEAANRVLLERAERLVAVWDGEPPGGRGGGTADVVLEARAAGVPVDVVWPEGAARGD